MTERAVRTASSAKIGPVSIWCAPDQTHAFFQFLKNIYQVSLYDQCAGDLGNRMLQAFDALTPNGPLIIIGVDCPALSPALLIECATILQKSSPVVFLPAEDGGYVLIGARSVVASLFYEIPWSTERVMEITRTRLREKGIPYLEPAILWDVDSPEDYNRARSLGLV